MSCKNMTASGGRPEDRTGGDLLTRNSERAIVRPRRQSTDIAALLSNPLPLLL